MDHLIIRNAVEADYDDIIPLVDKWWGGRNMAAMLPRLFFQHFRDTSYIVTTTTEPYIVAAFLIGFVSQTHPDEGYIHFVGVNPEFRKSGLGRRLYLRFFEEARKRGCKRVLCVTSPVNSLSIAFHLRMGFRTEPGDSVSDDGVPYKTDYDGPGESRVRFVREI